MTRTGIDVFWASPAASLPRVGLVEILPVALLLALCLGLTVWAGPVMRYMQSTAQSLHMPQDYLRGVFPEPPAPGWRGEGR